MEQVDGFRPTHAVAWKDGQLMVLDPDHFRAQAFGVDAVNGDFYVVGEGSGNASSVAKYWKNGEEVIIDVHANLSTIDVTGTDVYVAGEYVWFAKTSHLVASYWINGERIELSSLATFGYAYDMCVVPRP
jgi:hypothetical protein